MLYTPGVIWNKTMSKHPFWYESTGRYHSSGFYLKMGSPTNIEWTLFFQTHIHRGMVLMCCPLWSFTTSSIVNQVPKNDNTKQQYILFADQWCMPVCNERTCVHYDLSACVWTGEVQECHPSSWCNAHHHVLLMMHQNTYDGFRSGSPSGSSIQRSDRDHEWKDMGMSHAGISDGFHCIVWSLSSRQYKHVWWRTWQHPTGRYWVDNLLKPMLFVHQFLRAERGDWLFQQLCLERMLLYFFSAGHIHYAQYIIWHLLEMHHHLPIDAKADIVGGSRLSPLWWLLECNVRWPVWRADCNHDR